MNNITKDEALDLFYEYLGPQDDFELEWEMFLDFLKTSKTYTKEEVISTLEVLIEGLTEEDKEPRARKKAAIAKALAVANS
jgi:hypothetical protein